MQEVELVQGWNSNHRRQDEQRLKMPWQNPAGPSSVCALHSFLTARASLASAAYWPLGDDTPATCQRARCPRPIHGCRRPQQVAEPGGSNTGPLPAAAPAGDAHCPEDLCWKSRAIQLAELQEGAEPGRSQGQEVMEDSFRTSLTPLEQVWEVLGHSPSFGVQKAAQPSLEDRHPPTPPRWGSSPRPGPSVCSGRR